MFKKSFIFLFVFTLLFGSLSLNAFAEEQNIENNLSTYEIPSIEEAIDFEKRTDKVLRKSINLNLISLDDNGKIKYLGDQKSLKINDDLYAEFLERIDSINFLVEKKVASVNENFEVTLATPEEIAEISFNEGRNSLDNYAAPISIDYYPAPTSLNYYPAPISINNYAVPIVDNGYYPYINLKTLVTNNRKEIVDFFYNTQKIAPTSAYSATVGYWVGKVMEHGPWDYKRVSGFSPYTKKWDAGTYSGRKIITTEYIGNYNYGFTGEFLFSLNTLYLGGQIANGLKFWQPEDENDRRAIREGYNDGVSYGK